MKDKPSSTMFGTGHYASGLQQKLRRTLELGPKYYLVDVPRYVRQRRKLGLGVVDLGALWNPVRSFRPVSYTKLPLPPKYDEALSLLAAAGVRFDNPPARTEALVSMWWDTRSASGDAIECGAFRGATSLLLAVLGKLNNVEQTVHMLDTFAGMPEPSTYDLARASGEFAPPEGWTDMIRMQTEKLGVADRTKVHKGFFSETFARWGSKNMTFAFAHIDANIFQGTLDACEYVVPRMVAGGAVVFDDYNGLMDLGARLAIDSYLRGRRPEPLAECSAYLRT
jgi:O-methyltransferase